LADQTDNDALIRRCLAHDRQAQRQLFYNYKERVFRLVYRLIGGRGRADIEDAIQQTFIGLFKSLDSFRGEASLDTWVYRICVKVCTSAIRRTYSKGFLLINPIEDPDSHGADHRARPDSVYENFEIGRRIHEALQALRPERRIAFVLTEIEGKSLEEAAGIVGRPVGTIKSRVFRARNDLAKILRPLLDGEQVP
jgi:RNA polymerase sigma-70 factor, ECF subfamily